MLMQFVVENFLSFRDKTVLSMLAAPGVEHAKGRSVRVPGFPEVTRCAAIYGANASGKSNLVKALAFARNLVVKGTRSGERIGITPFRLNDPTRSSPSRFEFEVLCAGKQYSYGFVIGAEAVEAEWLFESTSGAEHKLFERSRAEDHPERPTIEFGDALAPESTRKQFFGFVAEGTRPNQLFLTEAAERNVRELHPLFEWFVTGLSFVFPEQRFPELAYTLHQQPALQEFVAHLLQGSGIGISGLSVERLELEALRWRQNSMFLSVPPDVEIVDRPEVRAAYRISTRHMSESGAPITFTLSEESDGTQRLLHLAPNLYQLVQLPPDEQRTYVIDELDRSLHTLLTRAFLETFFESALPDAQGQLVFTTHDTNLLDLNLLGRDMIWFTEKDRAGASSLYSLAEFKAEQLDKLGENLERGYLQGRFGAIPFLGDPKRLGWVKDAAE